MQGGVSKLFKFKIISFKTSFYSILIAFGAMIGTQMILGILFSEQIVSQPTFRNLVIKLMMFSWGIFFIAGSVAVKKLFKITVIKSIVVFILTAFFAFFSFTILIVPIVIFFYRN